MFQMINTNFKSPFLQLLPSLRNPQPDFQLSPNGYIVAAKSYFEVRGRNLPDSPAIPPLPLIHLYLSQNYPLIRISPTLPIPQQYHQPNPQSY